MYFEISSFYLTPVFLLIYTFPQQLFRIRGIIITTAVNVMMRITATAVVLTVVVVLAVVSSVVGSLLGSIVGVVLTVVRRLSGIVNGRCCTGNGRLSGRCCTGGGMVSGMCCTGMVSGRCCTGDGMVSIIIVGVVLVVVWYGQW